MICNETDGSGPHDDVWTRRISGMRIYSGERMESDLRRPDSGAGTHIGRMGAAGSAS